MVFTIQDWDDSLFEISIRETNRRGFHSEKLEETNRPCCRYTYPFTCLVDVLTVNVCCWVIDDKGNLLFPLVLIGWGYFDHHRVDFIFHGTVNPIYNGCAIVDHENKLMGMYHVSSQHETHARCIPVDLLCIPSTVSITIHGCFRLQFEAKQWVYLNRSRRYTWDESSANVRNERDVDLLLQEATRAIQLNTTLILDTIPFEAYQEEEEETIFCRNESEETRWIQWNGEYYIQNRYNQRFTVVDLYPCDQVYHMKHVSMKWERGESIGLVSSNGEIYTFHPPKRVRMDEEMTQHQQTRVKPKEDVCYDI